MLKLATNPEIGQLLKQKIKYGSMFLVIVDFLC